MDQSYPALLQTVSDEDLTCALVVLLCNGIQGGVICFLVTDQWAICLNEDLVVETVLDCFLLLVPGVELQIESVCYERHSTNNSKTYLNLVDMWRPCLSVLPQLFNLANAEVADADSLGLALLE